MTDQRTITTTPQEHADFLFDELSTALRHLPGNPAEALDVLRAADQAFDALHAWLRAGNPLPQPWRDKAKARLTEEEPEGTG